MSDKILIFSILLFFAVSVHCCLYPTTLHMFVCLPVSQSLTRLFCLKLMKKFCVYINHVSVMSGSVAGSLLVKKITRFIRMLFNTLNSSVHHTHAILEYSMVLMFLPGFYQSLVPTLWHVIVNEWKPVGNSHKCGRIWVHIGNCSSCAWFTHGNLGKTL